MIANFVTAFLAGLWAPLGAVCVLPLYPAFISFLTKKLTGSTSDRKIMLFFGLVMTLGTIIFMTIIGLLFTTILNIGLNSVIEVITPIAFFILLLMSILLLLDKDISKLIPQAKVPRVSNPLLSAFVYGLFFGAIVIPCNPGVIAPLFSLATTASSFAVNMLQFILFGIGLGTPLIVLSALGASKSHTIVKYLTKHKTAINRIAGAIMFVLSIYFLLFDFNILGIF